MAGIRGRTGLLLVLVGLFAAPLVVADEPTSVVDWLRARGQDASFEARGRLYAEHFPGESYRGEAAQNMRLLDALRDVGPEAPRPTGERPPSEAPAPFSASGHGWHVTLDRGSQVLQLDVPERVTWERQPGRREEPAQPTLALDGGRPPFVSAAMLAAKAKQFDDGLYAAVELASRRGLGKMIGKAAWLEDVRRILAEQGNANRGAAVFCAARDYGNGRHGDPLPPALRAAVAREKAAFVRNPLRSKPIGFYTWSDELTRIFRSDRMLQAKLTSPETVETAAAAIRGNTWKEAPYRQMLALAAGLTNPLVGPDVLQPSTVRGPSVQDPWYVLPPSRAHETELAKRLWGAHVPEGANLFDELIPRVRSGEISLAPREDSGWYDHVTWSLEPLLRPEAQPEAKRLRFTKGYREHLEELFKGLLALTRETHVKQLETPFCGACAPPPEIPVGPGLTVEPLATHYRRRAGAYRFVRSVLETAFGPGALAGMRRQTIDGPVAIDLDTELDLVTRIFDGAAETALFEIGAFEADLGPKGEAARAVFRTWRILAASDPDLAKDARMMVPVFYDVERGKTKVWVFLGWRSVPLNITYAETPGAVGWKRGPGASARKPKLVFHGQHVEVAYPVVAEVYVTEQTLDRRAMRAHCDRHRTRSAILRALR